MIRIEVTNSEVETRTSRKLNPRTNQPYIFHEQQAFAFVHGRDGQPSKYPVRFRISLEDSQEAYKPGFYTIHPNSIYVDKYGSLAIGRVVLSVLQSAKAA